MKATTHFRSYLAQLFFERNLLQTKDVKKLKTYILCLVRIFRKSCRLCDNVLKCERAGQATDDNMAHAHCMSDTEG
jgi:hypothetical protein